MLDPSLYHTLTTDEAGLVRAVTDFTREYFRHPRFDASHDFNHVLRVVGLAVRIMEGEQRNLQSSSSWVPSFRAVVYDPLTVILGAVLHDVDDRKYRADSGAGEACVKAQLLGLGLEEGYASHVQTLVDGVSYSSEVKNPQRVRDLIVTIPELAVVQDADRLDAIGAVGIGRMFAYGAAKTSRDLGGSVEHIDDKLLHLEGMMKTDTGRALARVYTDRLKVFKSWWQEEIDLASTLA